MVTFGGDSSITNDVCKVEESPARPVTWRSTIYRCPATRWSPGSTTYRTSPPSEADIHTCFPSPALCSWILYVSTPLHSSVHPDQDAASSSERPNTFLAAPVPSTTKMDPPTGGLQHRETPFETATLDIPAQLAARTEANKTPPQRSCNPVPNHCVVLPTDTNSCSWQADGVVPRQTAYSRGTIEVEASSKPCHCKANHEVLDRNWPCIACIIDTLPLMGGAVRIRRG